MSERAMRLMIVACLAILLPVVAAIATAQERPAAPEASAETSAETSADETSGSVAPEKAPHVGGEANLKLPDLSKVKFLDGWVDGHTLLYSGIFVSLLGLAFGMVIYLQLQFMPVHQSMREV